jgi:class 3 adenylate cyclase
MTQLTESPQSSLRFDLLAYLGPGVSLGFCFSKAILGIVAPLFGLAILEMNPHVQAVLMSLFAAGGLMALFFDRHRHGDRTPTLVGLLAFSLIVGTLYIYYDSTILMVGYAILLSAAFLNQNALLVNLKREVEAQASELEKSNQNLERRVERQVNEIDKLARLKRFLPAEVAKLITAEGKESLLESHRRYITCLFCDIRRFTSMSENLDPEDVMDVLRAFHEQIDRLVASYSGTIGYRAGDGVMVFFNDPIPCDNPDDNAVRLAFDLQQAFAALCKRWEKLGIDVGLGIGIASGYATMGVIGVEGRCDYTPIGKAVNLAARLSDHAQDGEILISRRTWVEVEDLVISHPAGQLSLKGLAQPVDAYFIGGKRPTSTVVPLAHLNR